ncbi:dopamine receptor 2-like [Spea bombifrons]|uniref:dopamine receptor 2-like n=1 Tax=Spea bombifrons TaxID=233779 RepID=UPI0023496053|nr:dopamine receptor 2-like [Spea bombifrons]
MKFADVKKMASWLLDANWHLLSTSSNMGNILVIVVIAATKGFHSVTSLFIINLAISDCLVGLGVMPFVALSLLYDDWSNINELCLFVGYVSSVYCTASVLSVAAVSLDRYWAIVDCLKYDNPWTTQRSLCIIIWIWVQAALTCCPPLLGWSRLVYVPSKYTCTIDWANSTSYALFFSAVSFFLPASMLIYCYIRIVIIAIMHAKKIRILENQLQKNSPRKKIADVEKPTCSKLIYIVNCKLLTDPRSCDSQSVCSFNPDCLKNIKRGLFAENDFYGRDRSGRLRVIFMVVVFICCWVPYMIINIIQAVGATTLQKTTDISSPVLTTTYWLMLLNSDLNPLLYALLSKRFQKALKVLLRKVCSRVSLENVPHSLQRRRTSSNITGISHIHCSSDQHNPGENSAASTSPVPSRHSSQQDDEAIPGQFLEYNQLSVPPNETHRVTEHSCVLNPRDLPHQFLQVPSSTSYQIRLPTVPSGKKSTLVCGNITIKVSYEDN